MIAQKVPAASTAAARAHAGSSLLRVEHLTVHMGGGAVVRDVDLEVFSGEVVGLVGPNGAGKSTLMRAVTGMRASAGAVTVLGKPLASYRRNALFRDVAVVQQLPEAPPTLTVGELVLLGRYPHLGLLRREGPRDREIAREAMVRAGCDAFEDRALGSLSGGERRRAFIARALAQEPRLLLLDEPTANLDADAQAHILEVLRTLARSGVGVLVVLHDLTYAAAYCDRLVLMHHGEVIAAGRPDEVVTPAVLERAYGPRVRVLTHPETGVPLVVPAVGGYPAA